MPKKGYTLADVTDAAETDDLFAHTSVEPKDKWLTKCGKEVAHFQGPILWCQECLDLFHRGEFPRVCEPWDSDITPPEKRYAELLRAARVLLDAEVTGEGKIIPTLAFAARLWESAYLQHIRDQLVKASQDPERWLELRDRFINSFSSLEALEVMNGVLVVRQIPISIHSAVNEADVVEEVSIDVFRRSVQPKAVAAFYKKSLRSHGISYNTDRGDVSYQVYPNYIRVTVRPENRWIDLVGKHRVYPKMETQQQSFPPPQVIESMYAAVKGSISRKPPDGFAYVLAGNERGPEAEADNLVSACVAWYVGNRGRLIQQGGLKPKVAQVLNEHLLEPCGRDTLPETGWDSSEPIWRNTKKWSQAILRVDHVLRDTYGSLGLGSDKFF